MDHIRPKNHAEPITGRFVAHTDHRLFHADDGTWWIGRDTGERDSTGEPKYIQYVPFNWEHKRKAKIFLEDENWYSRVGTPSSSKPVDIQQKWAKIGKKVGR